MQGATQIPSEGMDGAAVLEALDAIASGDFDMSGGRAFGHVFDLDPEVRATAVAAYQRFMTPNAINPAMFPSALRLEREVVRMVASHVHGDGEVVGNFTSGGTESIMLAVKAARDHARSHRRGLGRPALVVAETAHPAFLKAAHYLDMAVISVPVDRVSFVADVAAMAEAITPDTVMMVGSAPSYAHGVVDPIEELASLAEGRGLWFHVDACMGGVVLPFLEQLGEEIAPFDFRVPGVSSLSVDLHKYGFCPKGASLILHRDQAHRLHQLYACASWPGYPLVNTTVQSSRSIGALAAAWAVMHQLGQAGYREAIGRLRQSTLELAAGVEAIEGLRVLAPPATTLLAFGPEDGSTRAYRLADALGRRGWGLHPQPSWAGAPASLHLSVLPGTVGREEAFLADLAEAWAQIAAEPLTAPALPRLAGGGDLGGILEALGVGGEGVPREMAPINELLELLPPATREALLAQFTNGLYR